MGDGDGSVGRVSTVSWGWGIFMCRFPWLDTFSASLILPCSDETRGGVKTLPCSDKTSGLARILPCSNETWDSNGGGLGRGGGLDAGGTGVRSPGPGSNFLPRVLLDDWGGNTPETGALGSRWELGWFWIWFWPPEEDWTAMQLHLVMMMHQSPPLSPVSLIWLSHLHGDILEKLSGTDLRCKLYLSETSY
jgi:hypothetical protein